MRLNVWKNILIFPVVLLSITGCGLSEQDLPVTVPESVTAGRYTLYWGSQVKKEAVALINSSMSYCHFSVYELSDSDVLNALARAEKRGVDVEVVVDATEQQSQSKAVPFLKEAQVKVRSLKVSGGISHIKLLVVDSKKGLEALIGGMNFGKVSYLNHDASVSVIPANSGFEGAFQRDYADAAGGYHPLVNYPYPLLVDDQISPAMLQAISSAAKSIDIEAFALTSKPFIQALIAAAARGVKVRVVFDPHSYYQRISAKKLKAAGVLTCFYQPLADELLHAKILSIDHGRIFFIGSANFSRQAFEVNHEGDIRLFHVAPLGESVDQDVSRLFAES